MLTDSQVDEPNHESSSSVTSSSRDDLPYPAGNDDRNAPLFFQRVLAEFGVENPFEKIAIITVNHLVNTLIHFIPALAKVGRILGIVAKSSSTASTQKLKNHLTEKGYTFLPWTKQMIADNPARMVDEILALCAPDEKLLIVDIGGYFAPCVEVFSTDPRMKDRFLGIVEDTENGHQKYEPVVANANFPILSVARSELKKSEDHNVGKSIVSAADNVLRLDGHQLLERFEVIGVIGFGKIGRSCAEHLRQRGVKRLFVCEKDPIRAQIASGLGFKIVDHNMLLQESDFIISATGAGGIQGQQFTTLRNNAFIASVTSADDEFELSVLEAPGVKEEIVGDTHTFILPDKRINMLCRGNAVNFLCNAVIGPFIYSVQAELMVSAIHLIKGERAPESRLIEMRITDMKRIASQWLLSFESLPANESIDSVRAHFRQVQEYKTDRIFTLPETNPLFKGRKNLLTKLQELFQPEDNKPYVRCSIAGLGGTGKTELAIKFAWENRQYFSHACFISAENPEVMRQDFLKIATKIGIKVNPNDKKWLTELYQALSANGRTLLVFDNVNNFQSIQEFLPPTNNGYSARNFSVLITTRCQRIHRDFVEVLLDPDVPDLREDAIEYIVEHTECSRESAATLAFQLQYLALALSQAIAYININIGCTVEDYLKLFEVKQQRLQLLAHAPMEEKYRETVLTTWLISMESLNIEARDLLQLCAYFNPDNINIALLRLKIGDDSAIIQSLLQYSFVYMSSPTSIKIHRLLQEVIRDAVTREAGLLENITGTAINLLARYGHYQRSSITSCAEAVAHFNSLESITTEELRQQMPSYGELAFQLALYYLDHEYADERAERLLIVANNLAVRGEANRQLKINRHLAKVYVRRNKLDKAQEIFDSFEAIKEQISKKEYLEVSLDKYYFYIAKKEYDHAKSHLDFVLTLCDAPSLRARCLYYLGKWNKTKCNYLEKQIESKQSQLETLDKWKTIIRNNVTQEIATLLQELSGYIEQSINYFNQALAINRDQQQTKEIIRSTLQLCRVISHCCLPQFQDKAVESIINLYRQVLQECDPIHFNTELTQAAICLVKLFSANTPLFTRRNAREEFKEIITIEAERILIAYGSESEEYKAINTTSKTAQSALTSYFQPTGKAKSPKRSASPNDRDDGCIKRSQSSGAQFH